MYVKRFAELRWYDCMFTFPLVTLTCALFIWAGEIKASHHITEMKENRRAEIHYTTACLCVSVLCVAHLRALRGGMAKTLPTGLGPTAGGIMTSRPGEGLETGIRAGLIVGEAPLAGLRGRGLWGGKGDGLGCSSDTNWKRTNRKTDYWFFSDSTFRGSWTYQAD